MLRNLTRTASGRRNEGRSDEKHQLEKADFAEYPLCVHRFVCHQTGTGVAAGRGGRLVRRILHLLDGFSAAFQTAAPSFHSFDLCFGIAAAAGIRLAVYIKGKNAKKYRKNMEYGSARWGTAEDIKPFIDPVFENNILLTQTERLMMSNRPKNPRDARNKNVLVIGGSGSGKTRFFIKPNLMQMHSSYVVTDPNGYNLGG